MSTHYEWMPAGSASATYLPDGYDITTFEPAADRREGPVENRVEGGALVLSADEVVVLEGTLDELYDLADRIVDALHSGQHRRTYGPGSRHDSSDGTEGPT